MIKKIIISCLIGLSATGFVACSGGGDDDPVAPDPKPKKKSGTFLDSAVKGMSYSTKTKKGVTDEKGTFKYMDGEEVTFKVGGITIGSAKGQTLMTPLTLSNTENPSEFKVIQMLQFLQSIDSDHNASNGITISDLMTVEANRVSDNFTGEVDLLNLLNNLDVDVKDHVREEVALNHFKNTLDEMHKPTDNKEFSIIAGVYEHDIDYKDPVTGTVSKIPIILDITSSGVINAYQYDKKYNCTKTIPSSQKAAYAMNGKILTHDKTGKKFTLKINGETSGWSYDKDNKIIGVFYGANRAVELINKTDSNSSVFLTTVKSKRFTKSEDFSDCKMCTGFERVKGAYYDSVYDGAKDGYFCDVNGNEGDANTTKDSETEKKVQNSLIYIEHGKMSAYVMGDTNVTKGANTDDFNYNYSATPRRLCLRKVKEGDLNYRLNNVYLSKRVYKNTDSGIEMEYFYKDKAHNEKVSCIINADGKFVKVAYAGEGEKSIETKNTISDVNASGVAKVNGHIPSLNGMLTIVNDNYALTVKKDDGTGVADINGTGADDNTLGVGTPPLYTDENIEKSWCEEQK